MLRLHGVLRKLEMADCITLCVKVKEMAALLTAFLHSLYGIITLHKDSKEERASRDACCYQARE